jgi:hypothetical protein
MKKKNYENFYKKFQEERAEASIDDLKVHQKRRAIVLVSKTLDLLEVSSLVALDEKSSIEKWLNQGLLINIDDVHFQKICDQGKQNFSFIIVQPFVLIQSLQNLS